MSSKNHLKEITQQIVKEVAPDKIILFGSQTKKEQSKESDYDIFVLKNDITHRRKLAQRIYLKLNVDVPVDIKDCGKAPLLISLENLLLPFLPVMSFRVILLRR